MRYVFSKNRFFPGFLLVAIFSMSSVVYAGYPIYQYDDFGRIKDILYDDKRIVYEYDHAGNRTAHAIEAGGLSDPVHLGNQVDLHVNLSASVSEIAVGNEFTYTAVIKNNSGQTGFDTDVIFSPDDTIAITSVDSEGVCTIGQNVQCSFGDLGPNETLSLSFTAVPYGVKAITSAINVQTSNSDLLAENNSASVNVLITGSRIAGDYDGDGLPDQWETENGLDPYLASDANLDPDNDGLTSLQEYALGTDPNDADTDGDGVVDGEDDGPLFNPAWIVPLLDLLLD